MMFYIYLNTNKYAYRKLTTDKKPPKPSLPSHEIVEVDELTYSDVQVGSRFIDSEWLPPAQSEPSEWDILNAELAELRAALLRSEEEAEENLQPTSEDVTTHVFFYCPDISRESARIS